MTSPEEFFKVTVAPALIETFAVTIYCVAPTGSIASRQSAMTVPPEMVVPVSLSNAELPPFSGPNTVTTPPEIKSLPLLSSPSPEQVTVTVPPVIRI